MLTEGFMIDFSKLEDPRIVSYNSRHKFFDIIVMAFIAVLCGCDDWVEVARFCKVKIKLFKELLELPNGVPFLLSFYLEPTNSGLFIDFLLYYRISQLRR